MYRSAPACVFDVDTAANCDKPFHEPGANLASHEYSRCETINGKMRCQSAKARDLQSNAKTIKEYLICRDILQLPWELLCVQWLFPYGKEERESERKRFRMIQREMGPQKGRKRKRTIVNTANRSCETLSTANTGALGVLFFCKIQF